MRPGGPERWPPEGSEGWTDQGVESMLQDWACTHLVTVDYHGRTCCSVYVFHMFFSKGNIISQESFGMPNANMRLKKMSCSAGLIAGYGLVTYMDQVGCRLEVVQLTPHEDLSSPRQLGVCVCVHGCVNPIHVWMSQNRTAPSWTRICGSWEPLLVIHLFSKTEASLQHMVVWLL